MYIFLDIGGTNTRIGLSSDGESLDAKYIFESVEKYSDAIDQIINKIKDHSNGISIKKIVIGVPGTLDKDKSTLLKAPHLSEFEGKDLKKDIENALNCEAYLENDAALVGLGEAVYGAGKNNKIVAYITLSTGVGGVRLVDGCIDENRYGFEIGHHYILENKTFEDLVSGTAIEEKYKKSPKEISDINVWEKYTDILSLGVANCITFWSPDIVIIGGSMSRSVLFDRLNTKIAYDAPEYPVLPKVVPSKLDSWGGLYGGLAYIQNILDKLDK